MSSLQSDDPDHEIERILLAGFQVAAEKLSLDDAAWGRTSQRMRRLNDQIERDYARSRGTFARAQLELREGFSKEIFARASLGPWDDDVR
jgi:hypothetical protein